MLLSPNQVCETCKFLVYRYRFYTETIQPSVDRGYKQKLAPSESSLRFWESLSYSRNSLPATEPEGSLPCSQEPTICPCPELHESSPHLPTLFLQDPFWYYLPNYASVLPVITFQNFVCISHLPHSYRKRGAVTLVLSYMNCWTNDIPCCVKQAKETVVTLLS